MEKNARSDILLLVWDDRKLQLRHILTGLEQDMAWDLNQMISLFVSRALDATPGWTRLEMTSGSFTGLGRTAEPFADSGSAGSSVEPRCFCGMTMANCRKIRCNAKEWTK